MTAPTSRVSDPIRPVLPGERPQPSRSISPERRREERRRRRREEEREREGQDEEPAEPADPAKGRRIDIRA